MPNNSVKKYTSNLSSKMNIQLQQILQDQFLNKRIAVVVPERDNKGKIIPNKNSTMYGVCTYIGENKTLGWEIQVNVNHTPIQLKHVNDISVLPDTSRKRKF